MAELDDAVLGMTAAVTLLDLRIVRLEKAVLLLGGHVGATGWNAPLRMVLDAIQADLRRTGEVS